MIANENNMVNFMLKFKKQGYTDNYTIENGQLKSTQTGEFIKEEDFKVDFACQFDITENATDQQYLYSISTPKGKGLLVDILGNYLFDNYELLEPKFENIEIQSHLVEDPNRFVLRTGFPDFPTCPFDQTFSMLGYDNKNKEYVWLVTSIIRDKRLKRIEYSM
jgi:hypothetical protein